MSEDIKSVAVLEKSIQTLEFLALHQEGSSLKDIAQGVSLNKSTVYRILQTYRKYGYITQDPKSGNYQLGSRILIFAPFISNFDFISFIMPYMQSFSEETGLSISLALLEGKTSLTVENYIPTTDSSIRLCAMKGFCADLHSSASGKVFLSWMSKKELESYLKSTTLTANTAHTITDINALKEDLVISKHRGYSIENMENEENIISVAAPIIDTNGNVTAALATMTIAQLTSEDEIKKIGEKLYQTAMKVSNSFPPISFEDK